LSKNIEIKAHAHNFEQQQQIAEMLSGTNAQTLIQVDTFFNVESGRLKLREFPDAPAQLIHYNRNNVSGPKLSDYQISETHDGAGLKSILEKSYGIREVVEKQRLLFFVGRTRLHFDTVERLGRFIELEVVLGEEESVEGGKHEAQSLMNKLSIEPQHLIDMAYVDLLESAA